MKKSSENELKPNLSQPDSASPYSQTLDPEPVLNSIRFEDDLAAILKACQDDSSLLDKSLNAIDEAKKFIRFVEELGQEKFGNDILKLSGSIVDQGKIIKAIWLGCLKNSYDRPSGTIQPQNLESFKQKIFFMIVLLYMHQPSRSMGNPG